MRAALHDGAIAAAWESGRALSFEQALVEARNVADAIASNQAAVKEAPSVLIAPIGRVRRRTG
jgi:hypothetical protein